MASSIGNSRSSSARPRIAVIGLGSRVGNLIASAAKLGFCFDVAVVVDPVPDPARVERLPQPSEGMKFFSSLDEMIAAQPVLDGLVIGSRCDLHSELACKAAVLDLPLFLEKPVGITPAELDDLKAAYKGREHRVVVSFPLRVSPLFQSVQEIVSSGRLGQINQIQAVNYVPYGGVYFADWYRDYETTGGMWMQKTTHDFDYLGLLVASEPAWVFASESRIVYGGDKRPDLRCSQCEEQTSCLESPQNLKLRGDAGGMGDGDHWCAFSSSIRHHDAASAIIGYANGLQVTYTQNFVTRRPAGRRGAVITGYNATLEFDWRSESIVVHDHQRARTDRIEVKATTGHSGGDMVLWRNFLEVVSGNSAADPDLLDGIRSADLCLRARESCITATKQLIPLASNQLDGAMAPRS